MRFLCDVHISYKIVKFLNKEGHTAIHVNRILNKWNSKDSDICTYADEHDLIVMTKDIDFRDSFFLQKTPQDQLR